MLLIMEEEKILGKRLKQLRGSRTQEEMARALGLSRARYSHYENNRVEPDLDTLAKIANYHNVRVDYLIGRTNDPGTNLSREEQKMKEFFNNPELNLFFKDMKEASEEQLEELREIWEIIKRRNKKST